MLPSCFQPTAECGRLLARVQQGLTVDQADASLYVRLGLLYVVSTPTARSGYELTPEGEDALGRYVYSQLAGRS